MRRDFEKVLFLPEEAFADYFNEKVAIKLGRGSIFGPARLKVDEASAVAGVCADLYEKLNAIRLKKATPDFDFVLEKTYFDFEGALIDVAVQILQGPVSSASAAVMSPPLVPHDLDREKLLRHLARGEQEAAEAMLKKAPFLLSIEAAASNLRERFGTGGEALVHQSKFDGRVALKLGRGGSFGADELSRGESDAIKEIRLRYRETEAYIRASAEALCTELQETCLLEAAALLQAGESRAAPTAVASGLERGALASRKLTLFNASSGSSTLSSASRSSLSCASASGRGVTRNEMELRQFLRHVARGEKNAAEVMLKGNRELLIQAGEFTDLSGRDFCCTAYQYAYWSKDTSMRRMLESYMDEGAKVFLRGCLFDSKTGLARELSYSQRGVGYESVNFDLSLLINALSTYVASYDEPPKSIDTIIQAWLRVGQLQLDVSVSVAKAYCNPRRSFHPTPSFDEPEEEECDLFYWNLFAGVKKFWFDREDKRCLGAACALTRGKRAAVTMSWRLSPEHCESARLDLAALTVFDRKKSEELGLSKQFLELPVAAAAATGVRLR